MEIVKLLLKIGVIAFFYLGVGPALAYLTRGRDLWRRVALGFMAWWVVRPPGEFTLMLYSIEEYRGHTKGFEFNFLEAIAIGLALGALLERRKDFRWLPPGLWLWLLWVAAGLISLGTAFDPVYVLMPAFKFAKMAFVLVGVFAAVRDDRDIHAMMRGFAVALLMQIVAGLWGRYALGQFRVMGWFEHQNPMAMWSYMVALPMLGLALSRETRWRDVLLYLAGFGAGGLAVVLSVSRASLAAFVAGTALVVAGAFLQGLTLRRTVVAAAMGVGGALVLLASMETFIERMETAGDDVPENDLRVALNAQSKLMFEDRRLSGVGWNNFGIANSRPSGDRYSAILEDWERNRGRTIYPEHFEANPLTESLYWLILAENGLAGFVPFALFLALTLWHGLRATLAFWKTPIGLFLWSLSVALAITYLHGTVERVLTQTKNLTTWMMFCAILARAEWWRRQGLVKALRRPER